MENRVLEILKQTGAFLEGHFLLSSNRHSKQYVQCAKALRFSDSAEELMKILKEKLNHLDIDLVVGPAMGGVITSYELGRQLKKESIFSERENGEVKLRRGFDIKKGSNVIISEDVVTTGKSTLEVKKLIESYGANVLGVACIVDRRSSDLDIGIDVFSCIKLNIESFEQNDCPLCKQGIPAYKPGSRKIL